MKQYTLDTNVFRYKATKAEPQYKKQAKRFWKQVTEEIRNGEAVLFVPSEVKRELEVQSFTLGDKYNASLSELLEDCMPLPDVSTIEIEHQIRQMTAYVRSEYQQKIGREMEYGGVSDARILYTAYEKDSILVTSNIKDFLLYPLLFAEDDQDRLYDFLSNSFVKIAPELHQEIHNDEAFIGMLETLYELEENAEA